MKAIVSFYADALKIAMQSILAHKLRAFLTLIGIIIGVASVVAVGALAAALAAAAAAAPLPPAASKSLTAPEFV